MDTAILYNTHANPDRKTSLKRLTEIFLRWEVQAGNFDNN